MKRSMECIFAQNGFRRARLNHHEFWVHSNCYCRITYINTLSAFVIESADNADDAKKALFEDGDLYYCRDFSSEEFLTKFDNDLKSIYLKQSK